MKTVLSFLRPPAVLSLSATAVAAGLGLVGGTVYPFEMRPKSPGRFNAAALYEALDQQRRTRGMSWSQVAKEIGVSVPTLTRTRLAGRMEVDGMLAMVRWLGRTVESFTFGYKEP